MQRFVVTPRRSAVGGLLLPVMRAVRSTDLAIGRVSPTQALDTPNHCGHDGERPPPTHTMVEMQTATALWYRGGMPPVTDPLASRSRS